MQKLLANFRSVVFLMVAWSLMAAGFLYAGLAVELVSPTPNSVFPACANITVKANPTTDGEAIKDVYFYRKAGQVIGRAKAEPWEIVWQNVKPGYYPIVAKVRGQDGGQAFSDTTYILVGNGDKRDIIVNGGFDCDAQVTPWTTGRTGAAAFQTNIYSDFYFDDATYLAVEIDNGDVIDWYIQLLQKTGVDSGHTYLVSFYADAEDQKTIAINWQEGGDDWTVHWQMSDIVIAQAELYGPYEFVCQVTDPTADFKFILGGNDIDIYLDSVSIIDLNATAVDDKQDGQPLAGFELYPAYPNPFNLQTVIEYELPLAGHVLLDVYNMRGVKVKTLVAETQAEGRHSCTWNGADEFGGVVASGVYIYQLRAEFANTLQQKAGKIMLLK